MINPQEYIENFYGGKVFNRTVEVRDGQSIMDLMQDFSAYNIKSFKEQNTFISDQSFLDECAMRAMQGIVANITPEQLQDKYHRSGISITCYDIAYAMLKTRKELQK